MRAAGRPATAAEQAVLARWAAWGALPKVFVTGTEQYAAVGGELQQLLTAQEFAAARATTPNAHYTGSP